MFFFHPESFVTPRHGKSDHVENDTSEAPSKDRARSGHSAKRTTSSPVHHHASMSPLTTYALGGMETCE